MADTNVFSLLRLLLTFLANISTPQPQQSSPAPISKTKNTSEDSHVDDLDFDRYQRSLISLNRRLDSVEATLGGLGVLEIGMMTYLLEKLDGGKNPTQWGIGIFLVMALAISLNLLGVLEFQGDESPDIFIFHTDRTANRPKALAAALQSMIESFHFNNEQLAAKEKLRAISVLLSGIVLAAYGVHVLGWF